MNFSKILSNSAVSALRSLFTTVGTVITIPIITQLIGESEYGLWVTILAIVGTFAPIGNCHLHGALIRYTPTEDQDGQTFADSLILVTVIGGFVAIAFCTVAFSIDILPYSELPRSRNEVILSVGLLIYITILFNILKNYPRSLDKIIEYETILTIDQVIYVVAVPATLYLTRDLWAGIWTIVSLKGTITVSLLIRYYPTWVHFPEVNLFSKYFRYSLPMVPKSFSDRMLTHADKYLLLFFISPTATAIYAVTYQITTVFRKMTSVLNPSLYPAVTAAWKSDERTELKALYESILRGYVLLAIPTVTGLSLLATPILETLSTAQIASEGAILVPLISFGFILYGAENPMAYLLAANEDTDRIAMATISGAITNVLLNLLLIPRIGLFGAVTATVIAQALKTIYIFYQAHSIVAFDFPILPAIKATIASVTMFTMLKIYPVDFLSISRLIIYPAIGLLIYGLTLFLIRGIRINEVKLLLIKARRQENDTV